MQWVPGSTSQREILQTQIEEPVISVDWYLLNAMHLIGLLLRWNPHSKLHSQTPSKGYIWT